MTTILGGTRMLESKANTTLRIESLGYSILSSPTYNQISVPLLGYKREDYSQHSVTKMTMTYFKR